MILGSGASDALTEAMILNAMASSVLVITPALSVAFVNPAAEQLLGVSRTTLELTFGGGEKAPGLRSNTCSHLHSHCAFTDRRP